MEAIVLEGEGEQRSNFAKRGSNFVGWIHFKSGGKENKMGVVNAYEIFLLPN